MSRAACRRSKKFAEIPRKRGGLLILDAAQSAGEVDVDMQDLDVDALAVPV
jgi:selenocysteine lyase/cysteine desulfurase